MLWIVVMQVGFSWSRLEAKGHVSIRSIGV